MLLNNDDKVLFKAFNVDGSVLTYTAFNEKALRTIRTVYDSDLEFWILHRLIPKLRLRFKWHYEYQQHKLEQINTLSVGDVVTWIEGYDCTLHQFAKVVKKTDKSVIYQRYAYRGMNCTTKLEDLTPTENFFTKRNLCAYTNLYNPNHNYENNSD